MVTSTRIMRSVVTGAGLCLLLAGSAATSRADLQFFTSYGDYQQFLSNLGRQDATVVYNKPEDINGPALEVTGSSSFGQVAFQSDPVSTPNHPQENLIAETGQALIKAQDGGLDSLYITPLDSSNVFTALSGNPVLLHADNTGYATVLVQSQGTTFEYALGNGNNFFGIVAYNGQSFDSAYLNFFTDSTKNTQMDIADVRAIRVEMHNGPQEVVPEPAFYQFAALLGLGGLGILKLRMRGAA